MDIWSLAMPVLIWILLFAVTSLFWAWIVFWGGADQLEGTLASGFVIDYFAPGWSSDGIRIFGVLAWIVEGVWFLFGLVSPAARFF